MSLITTHYPTVQIGAKRMVRLGGATLMRLCLLILKSKEFKIRTLILWVLLIPFSASAQLPRVGDIPSVPDDWLLGRGQKWHHSVVPAKEPLRLVIKEPNQHEAKVVRRAQEILNHSSAKAILLMNRNEIIWTGYKAPADANSLFLSFSVGKTITSMAIGKALCANKLLMQDPVDKYVAELKGTHLGGVTIQQLLKMSSGTPSMNQDSTIYSPEQLRDLRSGTISVLDVLKTASINNAANEGLFGSKRKAGDQFDYHSTDPLALGVILNRATGVTYARWVEKEVLIPSGIAHEAIIGQDHFGFGAADGNIRMTLLDWGRFAYWVKANSTGTGCFSDYLKEATKTQIENSNRKQGKAFGGYGYLLWTQNNRQNESYWAVGYGGQRIAWNNQNQRVLIVFSNLENYMEDIYSLYQDWSSLSDKP